MKRPTLPDNPARLWPASSVKQFAEKVLDRLGPTGRNLIAPDVLSALCDSETLSVVCSQARDSIPTAAINCLRMDLWIALGLFPADDT